MTDCGDGSYEATAANQELLQTVDVAALSTQYGADSRVTGISLIYRKSRLPHGRGTVCFDGD